MVVLMLGDVVGVCFGLLFMLMLVRTVLHDIVPFYCFFGRGGAAGVRLE